MFVSLLIRAFIALQAGVVSSSGAIDAASSSGRAEGSSPSPDLKGRIARFRASKSLAQPIRDKERLLAEYMALPASQYSVLDARKIERIDENTFR